MTEITPIYLTVQRENLAGIKFGEMAKNGYKLILATCTGVCGDVILI